MDRKGIIAVALAIITLIGWTFYNQKKLNEAAEARRQAAVVEAQKQAEAPKTPEVPAAPAQSAPAPVPAEEEKTEVLGGPMVEYTFSNLGGGISKALLRTHEAEKGHRMVINEFGPTPIGATSEIAGEGARVPYNLTRDEQNGTVTFERTDARQIQQTKTYKIAKAGDGSDEYTLDLSITYTNKGTTPLPIPGYFVYAGAAAPIHQSDLATYTGIKSSGGKLIDVNWFSEGGFLFWKHAQRPFYQESRANLRWMGVTNQYFTSVISPLQDGKDIIQQQKQYGSSIWAKRFDVSEAAWTGSGREVHGSTAARHAVEGALGMPAFNLEPGQSVTQNFKVYAGPREFSRLKRLPSDEEEIMNFGIFGFVSKTLLNGMNWLHARTSSYAVAIILLTLIIKTLLWPLQNKATNSMKKMSALQPKMTELREKYKDDPQRMNVELMNLYKDYGINPFGGCLPMLIQIPVFFGFYNMLGVAVELRNSKFFWVQDLSLPDTVFHLGSIPVNILPLVMAGTMFWQMAISPKSGDAVQQRVFMFMPLIFVFFCYNFASALALYWTVQNLFSVVQLYVTRNQAPPELVKVSAAGKKK